MRVAILGAGIAGLTTAWYLARNSPMTMSRRWRARGCCPRRRLRPATPRGTPILGATPYANLFLNCGHGALGWTLALGSARIVADRIAGATSAIPQDGFELGPR